MKDRIKVVKPGNENKPWTSNYPSLEAWLNKHEARCMWQVLYGDKRDPTAYVECWQFSGGRLAILVVRSHGFGWEIYTPAGTNKVDETLADAERRLGLRWSKLQYEPDACGPRIAHSAVIGLCRAAIRAQIGVDRVPTHEELADWAHAHSDGRTCFPRGLTNEQAKYILDHPDAIFGEGE